MELREGMKVRVKKDQESIGCSHGLTQEMIQMEGDIVTVMYVDQNVIKLEEDTNRYVWHPRQFEQVARNEEEAFESYVSGDMSENEYIELINCIKNDVAF